MKIKREHIPDLVLGVIIIIAFALTLLSWWAS